MKSFFLSLTILASLSSFAQETKSAQDTVKPKSEKLSEVQVYGNKKKFLKIDSDKTTVSVKDNPMLSSGTAFEAVKKLQGVITSPTGSLILNGKGVMVYIDGSPSTLRGTDLQNYLSSLPATAIEKIEMIYNPGASFDANSSGSVINIVTTNKRLKGIDASFNINYNFNKYQKPSPQLMLNGKEKHFSWQTMLGYNYIDSEEKSYNNQQFTYFNPVKKLLQENYKQDTDRNLYFRVGTNFKLSKKSNLLFNYNGNYENNRSEYNSKITGDISDYYSAGTAKTKGNNHEVSLQYKLKLDTIGTNLDVVAFSNLYDKNPKNISNATGNTFNNSAIDFKLLNNYLKLDLTFPFAKSKFSINTGAKYNTLDVKNNGEYFINTSIGNKINFDYTENNLAFYAELRKKIKKLNLTAGLRFEDFKVTRFASTIANQINYNSTNFFPNLSAAYELTDKVKLSSSYSKKIQQPSYNNLDPNNGSTFNQYTASSGNINLKPTFYDNFDFSISAFDFVQLGANYTIGTDDSRFIFNAADGQFVSNQTTQGFDKIKTFSAWFSFPLPLDYFFKSKEEFANRMNNIDKMNYIFFNIAYVKSNIDGVVLPFGSKGITNYGMQSQINLPWGVTNNMNYFILPRGTWEIYGIDKPIQQFDISFNKNFMDKKLKVGLHCFDVFNANEINANVAGQNLNTYFYQKKDSRNFRISITYNFGNLKLQKDNTEIKTEKAKSGGGLIK